MEMDLLEGFFKFLKTQGLAIEGQSPILLAVSGGLDSVVMAHLFHRAGRAFAVAHCNFQLRGPESDGDEDFVEKMALSYDAPFYVKRFETKDYARDHGLSTQMAARELRYAWFAALAAENGFSGVATAHHLNDSVETALLNFARGTGPAGLSGIAPRSGILIRPLLFATRSEILDYSRRYEITWRHDSSNDSDEYARNFVRHHLVPRFEDLNPNFSHTAARNMGRIRETEENLAFLVRQWLAPNLGQDLAQTGFSIEKQQVVQLPSPEQALRHLLKPYGFDAEQARQIAENLDHIGLELHSEHGFSALIDRERVIVSPESAGLLPTFQTIAISEADLMLSLPDGSRLFLMPSTDFQPDAHPPTTGDPLSAMVDAEKLKFPLHLRHWLPGDSFQPLGMGGKRQKLQNFFTNQKLSRIEKENVWLLLNGDHTVVWVLGMRMDERFKIQSKTSKALKINWIR